MRRNAPPYLAVEQLERRQLLAIASPTNLVARPVSASEIGLSWELADATDTAAAVQRSGAGGGFVTVATLSAGETIFTDTGCWADTTYTYRVEVRDAAGESAYSAESTATSRGVGVGAFVAVNGLAVVPLSPTTVDVSFVDANTGEASHLLERSADGVSWAVVASLGTSTTWRDTGLDPGASYWYRVRDVGWTRPTSDYSAAVNVVLPLRPSAAPCEPSAVAAVAVSADAVRLTWAAGDTWPTQYAIERSVDYDPWHPVAWMRIATTAVDATSFTDTGLEPETPYLYRVLAVRGGLESEPGRPASDVMHVLFGSGVGVVTASAGTGAPRTYDIGPGRPLSRLTDLDWSRLGPGDVVNVHPTPGGYRELVQVSTRGTPSAWITINGIPDPVTGALPIIDAADAVLAPQFRNHYAPVHGSGAIVVGARPGFKHGYKPGYVTIRNLDIRNCHASQAFTDVDGTTKPYGMVGAGIYLERCDHVTIAACAIHDNGEGIFGAGQSDFGRVMTDITIEANRIWGNGNVGRDREHNTYLEAIDVVYQFNRYGPLRPGALGAGLKDRSAGTVIRFNWIEGGAHQLQIPEAQNQADLAIALPRYRRTIIEGNTLLAPAGNGASLIWFGGDQGLDPWYRKGVLSVTHNTLVARSDQSQVWKINAIEAASGGESLDVRNNILAAIPATPGGTRPEFGLMGRDNRASFGRNWVTPGWVPTTAGDATFTGHVSGVVNLFGGPANDPGFVDLVTGDYRLAAGSTCIDAAGRLPGILSAWPVTGQFVFPAGGAARLAVGAAADLGAFEAAVMIVAPPAPPAPTPTAGNARVSLSWTAPASNGGAAITDYVVQYKSSADATWTTFADGTSTTPSATVTGLTNGRAYMFRVLAVNAAGTGLPSANTAVVTPISFTPMAGVTIGSVEFGTTELGYAFRQAGQVRQVTYNGRPTSASYPGSGWTMRGVWADVSGYKALLRSGTNTCATWTLTAAGAYVSSQILTAAQVGQLETALAFDLDQNGAIG